MLLISIYLLPLVSFIATLVLSLYGYKNPNMFKKINFISWIIVVLAFLILTIAAFVVFTSANKTADNVLLDLGDWFSSGGLYVTWIFNFDVFTSSFVLLIAFISFLIVFYSYFYFHHQENIARFVSYISLFVFSMLILVTSSNLIQMLIGWEGVSFVSYLLIGFYYKNKKANYSAMKAFLINKAADVALLLAIFGLYALTGSIDFNVINSSIINFKDYKFTLLGSEVILVNTIAALILIAAFTKSAQIIFHIWLPDAMEAPTPVSALLHAATMVTAGIFLLIKLMPLYSLYTFGNNIILIVASITLLYAAIQACIENDIKKIIAYSTISQLAYMFLSLGVGYGFGAVYHLFTHAFFKALLFLGVGSIIYSTGVQNIKELGGLYKKLPITYLTMWIGFLSLIGVYGFSGYFSKESILTVVKNSDTYLSKFAFICAMLGVGLTTFYSLRLIIYTFHGKPSSNANKDVIEERLPIQIVLIVFAIFAIFIGKILFSDFVAENSLVFWKNSIAQDSLIVGYLDHTIMIYSTILMLIAMFFAYGIYIREKEISNKIKNLFPWVYKSLSNRLYLDLVYDKTLKIFNYISEKLKIIDDNIIEKYMATYSSKLILKAANIMYISKNKNIALYTLLMLIGVILLLALLYFYLTYLGAK